MTNFEEAKNAFKKFYSTQGYTLEDEGPTELHYVSPQSKSIKFKISEEELNEYLLVSSQFADVTIGATATSLNGPQFIEQFVDYTSPSSAPFPLLRQRPFIFEGAEGEGLAVEIGPASNIYFNFFRLQKSGAEYFLNRAIRLSTTNPVSLRDGASRTLTIKFKINNDVDVLSATDVTTLFESCLFNLSYMNNVHLELRNDWPSVRPRPRIFSSRSAPSTRQIPLRRVAYTVPVLRFYQRGVATDDAYIQFISFYHVLEFFFISVSDRILYDRLSRLLLDPAFRPLPKHLDRLITATEDHKRGNDETEMLKNVLSSYADENDIIDFIQSYETRENSKIFTDKSECFGDELEKISLKAGHVLGPIAKRIKTIRNSLIHSSDRYERKQRYLPGIEADRVLSREIPLLKYIAERVIIATAQPLA